MAEIIVKVTQTGVKEASTSLAALSAQIEKINIKPIKLNVDTKALNAMARYLNANSQLAVQQEKTRQAEARLAAQREKTTQATASATAAGKRLETQRERTKTATQNAATAEKRLETQQEKTRTAAQNAAAAEKRLQTQQEKTATANVNLQGKMQSLNQETQKHETILDSLKKNAYWQVLSAAVSSAISAFKDALSTMREVDSQLVTVRKVTGATTEEMKALEDQAYKTASAYGVTADQYLSSVAAFARAGYKDQSADLAELAVKTQLVGDVSEDVANQFLLSVDAAYQMNGSVTELSKVLDGANEIDNNYATSIEKIAEGLGIIAPVAAQAHVGIDELSAALGTITAVTQRSGSEAARALRALFLNIMGDTTTEIEDGATWTAGEIEGLRDVIKQYAADAYEAAEATGSAQALQLWLNSRQCMNRGGGNFPPPLFLYLFAIRKDGPYAHSRAKGLHDFPHLSTENLPAFSRLLRSRGTIPRACEEQLLDFFHQTGLDLDSSRLSKSGFGRSQASSASAAALRHYRQWADVPGFAAPQSLADYYRIRYNEPEQWARLRRDHDTLLKLSQKNWTDEFKQQAVDVFLQFIVFRKNLKSEREVL